MASPRNVYMINYYPAAGGGASTWADYNGAQTSTDMALAASLGFNTVRTAIQAVPEAFNFPGPPSAGQLANLIDFISRAYAAGMKVHLCLFDFWGQYGKVSASQTWAAAVVSAIQHSGLGWSPIQCLEMRNEVPFASTAAYRGPYDSGWPYSETGNSIGYVTTVWMQQMVPWFRTNAPGVSLTVSCTGGYSNLETAYNAFNGTDAALDWYEYHHYSAVILGHGQRIIAGVSANVHNALSGAIAAVGGDPENLFIGETGWNTVNGGGQGGGPYLPVQCGQAQAYQAQINWFQGMRWACQQLSLPEPAPWTLYDLTPTTHYAGQTFGLYTTDGQPKPVVNHYQQFPLGSVIPGVGINGNMLGAAQTDAAGNQLPAQWTVYQGQTAKQPIRANVDYTNLYNGNPSVLLQGSADALTSDQPPALEFDTTMNWPLLSGQQGNRLTVSVAMKATGTYGNGTSLPALKIGWYSWGFGTTGKFLSSTFGNLLKLTDEWQRFSLSGTIPVDADYARILIQVGFNAGSIWVAGAAIEGPMPVRMY
jgi:hypothetical protein